MTDNELLKRAGRRRAVLPAGNPETAARARVGKAAKKHGMTFDEWVALHGMADKLAGGADPRQRSLFAAKAKKKRRRKPRERRERRVGSVVA